MPSAPMVRVYPSYEHPSEVKIAPIVYKRLDKICLIPTKEMMPLIYLNARHVYVNEKILKRLRAGDLQTNLSLITIVVVVYIMMIQLSGVDPFTILNQLGRMNSGVCARTGCNFKTGSQTKKYGSIIVRTKSYAGFHICK